MLEFLRDEVSFNFSATDRWGKTPLDDAVTFKKLEAIEILSPLVVNGISPTKITVKSENSTDHGDLSE